MLKLKKIVGCKDLIISKLDERGVVDSNHLVNQAIELDDRRKQQQTVLDTFLHQSKSVAKSIGQLLKEGQHDKAASAKAETADLKKQIQSQQELLKKTQQELTQILYQIPNIHADDVPVGQSADDNVEVEQFGKIPELPDGTVPHWDLIKKYDIIDFEVGVKVAAAGFPVYKGQGARLQRALINFFLDEAEKAGYREIQPPIVVNETSGYATGQLPDKEGQMYELVNEGLFMIPTAEVPITNLYRDAIIDEADLPIKNVGYTPCFRREAGSWGAHVRGLNRLHQFDKVEIIQIVTPETSYETLLDMRLYVKSLLEKLELPVRILNLCSGDLGFTSAQTFDMEVFSAAQKMWLEVSSISNFEDFQANRLKLRYRDQNKTMTSLHTLNGSALALPRIVAALLENNQTPDGIRVPSVLQPYTGFDMIK